jgi:hypothetical protein
VDADEDIEVQYDGQLGSQVECVEVEHLEAHVHRARVQRANRSLERAGLSSARGSAERPVQRSTL